MEVQRVLFPTVAMGNKFVSRDFELKKNRILGNLNFTLFRTNFALLTLKVELLKFMDFVMDFQIRIYLHTNFKNSVSVDR